MKFYIILTVYIETLSQQNIENDGDATQFSESRSKERMYSN